MTTSDLWKHAVFTMQNRKSWEGKRISRLGQILDIIVDDSNNNSIIAKNLALDMLIQYPRSEFLQTFLVLEEPDTTIINVSNVDRAKVIAKSSLTNADKRRALFKLASQSNNEEKVEIQQFINGISI